MAVGLASALATIRHVALAFFVLALLTPLFSYLYLRFERGIDSFRLVVADRRAHDDTAAGSGDLPGREGIGTLTG